MSLLPDETLLDEDEKQGLIPTYVQTQAELNELEQANILEAALWVRQHGRGAILSEESLKGLHRRMFGKVWRWAGTFRKSNKNIGAEWRELAVLLRELLADTQTWISARTYPWDEIACRFHHRLVFMHLFPNGNGRHARLAADALLLWNGQQPFTWGENAPLRGEGPARKSYLAALRAADENDLRPLLSFVRL